MKYPVSLSIKLLAPVLMMFAISFAQAQITVSLGSGTMATSPTPSGTSPYNLNAANRVMQFVYTASEIKAAGGVQGEILSLAWKVKDTVTTSIPDYGIWMKQTTATNVTSHDNANLKQVKNRYNYPHGSPGWQTQSLDTAFYWDGSKNILVHVCYGNINATSASGTVYVYNNVSNQSRGEEGKLSVCGSTSTTAFSSKPFIQFVIDPDCIAPSNISANNVGTNNADIAWKPSLNKPKGYEYVLSSSAGKPTRPGTYVTDTMVKVTGLCPNKLYFFYVRSVCDAGDTSDWSQGFIFQTTAAGGITTNAPICVGDTLKMSVESAKSYAWTGPSGYKSNIQHPVFPNAQKGHSGTYFVSITDANNCVVTYSSFSSVDTLPVPILSTNAPKCEEEDVTIKARDGGTYLWTGPNGFIGDTSFLLLSKASASQTGFYVVRAENSFGCKAEDSIFVEINPLPVSSVTATSPICSGDTLLISASGNYDFKWAGPNSMNHTGANVEILNASTAAAGKYEVVATTDKNCSKTYDTRITVNPTPNVQLTGKVDLCEKDELNLTASGAESYQWLIDNKADSNSGNVFKLVAVQTGNKGKYRVIGTDAKGCSAWDEKEVDVKELPVGSIDVVKEICEGQDLMLKATSNATGNSWLGPDGKLIASNPVYTILSVTQKNEGLYTFKAIAANGCSLLLTRNIDVKPKPTIVIDKQGNNLVATAGFGSYKWFVDGIEIPGKTTVVLTAEKTGKYTVEVMGGNGCVGTSEEVNLTNLGIDATTWAGNVLFYPNPVKSVLNIKGAENLNSIRLYDAAGREVLFIHKPHASYVDLSNLNPGFYVIRMEAHTGMVTRQIIKE